MTIAATYRVSTKSRPTFLSSISQLPRGPIWKGWTFFYSSLSMYFRDIFDFEICRNFDQFKAKLVPETKNKIIIYTIGITYIYFTFIWN